MTFREVKQQLVGALQGRTLPSEALPIALSQSMEQVIARVLITAEMRRRNMKPTDEELKQAEEAFNKNLQRRGLTRAEYLKQNLLTEDDLEKVRYWEICWNRFARELLNDDHLKQFFEAHHRDFDGTQLRVSHVLLRIEGTQDQGTVQAAVKKAAAIREELTAGRTTFADAALRFSAGPSREQGGDIGFIPRRERMVEEFSSAAFRLKKGELSQPVVTPFGVHLITVTDEQPGLVKWQDVRDQLIAAAQLPLFRQLAAQLRPRAKIEYTGALPPPQAPK
ncbi:MAG: peptidylprolyl isomerase [Pirellulales bacterium]